MKKRLILMLPLVLVISARAYGDPISGTITNWPESSSPITIGDGTNSVNMWWSIAYTGTPATGYFYGSSYVADSDVAVATGVTDISQLTNAAAFTYTSGTVGPVPAGNFILYRNTVTGYYAALLITNIAYPDGLSGTWWFQTDGSANLSPSSVVAEPSSVVLLAAGLVFLLVYGGWPRFALSRVCPPGTPINRGDPAKRDVSVCAHGIRSNAMIEAACRKYNLQLDHGQPRKKPRIRRAACGVCDLFSSIYSYSRTSLPRFGCARIPQLRVRGAARSATQNNASRSSP